MTKPNIAESLPDLLQFHPKIWWDPVPWWFINQLDRGVLAQLATVQLELQREMLQSQVKSVEKALHIVAKSAG